ncbi:ATP-binding protein [Streptomyces sp. NPDC056835]|uniref:ATP-binding protein n=1 Tax=Streptomyces sp. NPDC056835 TaxID=3345956 RepID=UPI0036AF1D2D
MLTDSGLVHDVYDQGPPWLPLARIPLPHRPEAAPRARRHAREVLALRRVDSELIATVELAVSELVTNAVRHGLCLCGCTRGTVSLTLLRTGSRLRVEVADPSRTPPRWPTGIESVDAETEEGRGLLLVTALAADWGDQAGPTRGKVVWCEFAPATRAAPVATRGATAPAAPRPAAGPAVGPPAR